jgi:hypothetical protein
MESKLISMLFNNYSGSATSQPVRIVPPSSTPTTSYCPDGDFFPTTTEQMTGGNRGLSSNMESHATA